MKVGEAVLITGCTGGIGRALCQVFRAAGYFVIGSDVGEKHNAYCCDQYISTNLASIVENDDSHKQFKITVLEILLKNKLKLKALINNAASQIVKPIGELSISEFNYVYQVNVLAPFILVKTFESFLRNVSGSIVNIGSIHANLTKPGFCAYSTSKAALSGLTRAIAIELGSDLNINTILPAATQTEMLVSGFKDDLEKYRLLESYHPAKRIASPLEIAELALFLCSSKSSFINGAEIPIDGGIGGRLHDPG